MPQRRLKLKQASAVLKVEPKELQNLVQFGVVKPKRVDGVYLFDKEALLTAKVAFRLKESLGTRANVLSKLIDVFRASEKGLRTKNPEYVVFTCRFSAEEDPIKFRNTETGFRQQNVRTNHARHIVFECKRTLKLNQPGGVCPDPASVPPIPAVCLRRFCDKADSPRDKIAAARGPTIQFPSPDFRRAEMALRKHQSSPANSPFWGNLFADKCGFFGVVHWRSLNSRIKR